jgi:hypothetical protein
LPQRHPQDGSGEDSTAVQKASPKEIVVADAVKGIQMELNPFGQYMVPTADATQLELVEFALTFNGYDRNRGGASKVAPIAKLVHDQYFKWENFPDDLHQVRTALFWEQRLLRNNEQTSGNAWANAEPYWRALVAKIFELTGGTIQGMPDEAP